MYIACPIISETALRMGRVRDLSANYGTTTCILQSITDTRRNQWSLYIQMRPRYSWLPKTCWDTSSEMLTTLPYHMYMVYRRNNDIGNFQQVTCNCRNIVHCLATWVKTKKFAFVLSKLCICDHVNMEVQTEQRYTIKFCVWLQKFDVETLAMLRQCYGEHCFGCAMILLWHAKFTADLEQSAAALHSWGGCKVSVRNIANWYHHQHNLSYHSRGTPSVGMVLHCQRWLLFKKRNSCNLPWLRLNR